MQEHIKTHLLGADITEYVSNSSEETVIFAQNLSKYLEPNDVIAFTGGMGMGKTAFTSGLAFGLGFTGDVTSPTFALVNEYRGGRLDLFHFDMYRIESWEDLYSTGFFEYSCMGGVCAVEWSENIEGALDENTIRVNIEYISDNSRKITVTGGKFNEDIEH